MRRIYNAPVGDVRGVCRLAMGQFAGARGSGSTTAGMGLRHTGFFRLGLALKRLGLDDNEIMGHLTDADYDGSRRKKKAIEGVLKSLKSSKWAS